MSGTLSPKLHHEVCAAYEETRRNVIEGYLENAKVNGYAVMVRNGFLAWTRATIDRFNAQHRSEFDSCTEVVPWATEVETLVANIILDRLEV